MPLWTDAGYLDCLQILARVQFIYQIAFPNQPEWQSELYAPTNQGVRHALITLCLRFADHLFPLAFSLDWLQQIDVRRNFNVRELDHIPIAPRGVDVLEDPYYHHPDTFKPPYDFFVWGFIHEMFGPEVEELRYLPEYPLPFSLPRNWSLEETARLIRQASLPEPLSHLALIADYIAARTGNIWLDADIDQYYETIYAETPIAWTTENVRSLKELHDQAVVIESQMAALAAWVAVEEESRMKAILALVQILYANEYLNDLPQTVRPPANGQPFRYAYWLPSR
ncbi:MAG: hypothetical protein H6656_00445 [Ardenticatenaceae bacterium]|nr:hypothetical protein [Anaerolineales bacterium]MCB9005852.1 hypothetical protein [Ardenticatenaceae bacterium]